MVKVLCKLFNKEDRWTAFIEAIYISNFINDIIKQIHSISCMSTGLHFPVNVTWQIAKVTIEMNYKNGVKGNFVLNKFHTYIFCEIKQLSHTSHTNMCVVLRHYAHVLKNKYNSKCWLQEYQYTFTQVLQHQWLKPLKMITELAVLY